LALPDPVDLTRELIAIPSPTGREQAVTRFLGQRLEELGWTVVRQAVEDGRENLYAMRGQPVVVLSTHLDTVPPELPVREDHTTLYGRGTCDAKGIAAAMIAAASVLAAGGEPGVGLLFVVGEEDGSHGARAAAALQPKGRYLVNGEPTEGRLVTAQKGALRVTLRVTGVAAHSGYPELGDSAIDRLLDALARIRMLPLPTDPVLGACTLNIGVIDAGAAPNVVAPAARAELLFRLVGPSDALRRAVSTAAGPGVDVEFPTEIPSVRAPALDGWPSTTVAFASDLPFLEPWGIRYQLGPGSIHVAHTADECIAKDALREGRDRYVALVRELLRQATAAPAP
jgi:acetylornithine deacetylase